MKDEVISKASAVIPIALASDVNDIYELVLLVIGILSAIISMSYTIYKWYLKAMHDKKITIEELEELETQINKKRERK